MLALPGPGRGRLGSQWYIVQPERLVAHEPGSRDLRDPEVWSCRSCVTPWCTLVVQGWTATGSIRSLCRRGMGRGLPATRPWQAGGQSISWGRGCCGGQTMVNGRGRRQWSIVLWQDPVSSCRTDEWSEPRGGTATKEDATR